MDKSQPDPFATRLAALRREKNMTLQELGDTAGLSRQRVHQLEAGTHQPRWDEVRRIADALGVPIDHPLAGD